jgi:hypothetical protein
MYIFIAYKIPSTTIVAQSSTVLVINVDVSIYPDGTRSLIKVPSLNRDVIY